MLRWRSFSWSGGLSWGIGKEQGFGGGDGDHSTEDGRQDGGEVQMGLFRGQHQRKGGDSSRCRHTHHRGHWGRGGRRRHQLLDGP
ncbi:MAG: hypothetical protein Q8P67_00100 [archaeon]|nr:hypothetical protein [archaeon]